MLIQFFFKDELFDALACVVGRNFSQDQRKSFLDILDLSVTSGDSQLSVRIYFQTWCGISALCERIYGKIGNYSLIFDSKK